LSIDVRFWPSMSSYEALSKIAKGNVRLEKVRGGWMNKSEESMLSEILRDNAYLRGIRSNPHAPLNVLVAVGRARCKSTVRDSPW